MGANIPPELQDLPISKRPPKTWSQTLNALLFIIVFDFANLMINAFQFVIVLPIRLIPVSSARNLYDEGIRYSKGAFGILLGSSEVICRFTGEMY